MRKTSPANGRVVAGGCIKRNSRRLSFSITTNVYALVRSRDDARSRDATGQDRTGRGNDVNNDVNNDEHYTTPHRTTTGGGGGLKRRQERTGQEGSGEETTEQGTRLQYTTQHQTTPGHITQYHYHTT